MARIAGRVERLRRDLSSKLLRGFLTTGEINRLRDTVASLVISALNDDDHPLGQQVEQLKTLIAEYGSSNRPSDRRSRLAKSRRGDDDKRLDVELAGASGKLEPPRLVLRTCNLFMPEPGTSLRPMREFWPVQMLLLTASLSSHGEQLAAGLGLEIEEWRSALQQACAGSVQAWSQQQYGSYLEQALSLLNDQVDAGPRLDGALLVHGAQRLRLSSKQAIFMRLMLNALGKDVHYDEFRKHGIANPIKLKCDLMRKLSRAGISLQIISTQSAYMLPDA